MLKQYMCANIVAVYEYLKTSYQVNRSYEGCGKL